MDVTSIAMSRIMIKISAATVNRNSGDVQWNVLLLYFENQFGVVVPNFKQFP